MFFPVFLGIVWPVPASSFLTVGCVLTVTADERQLHTMSDGSDVSPATDQLTADKHGRWLGFFSTLWSVWAHI